MIIELIEVEIVADPRAERRDHRADLLVGEHLIEPFFLDVERFSAQGKNGLKLPHARLLRRAARRIALDDKQLVKLGFLARTGGELAHER